MLNYTWSCECKTSLVIITVIIRIGASSSGNDNVIIDSRLSWRSGPILWHQWTERPLNFGKQTRMFLFIIERDAVENTHWSLDLSMCSWRMFSLWARGGGCSQIQWPQTIINNPSHYSCKRLFNPFQCWIPASTKLNYRLIIEDSQLRTYKDSSVTPYPVSIYSSQFFQNI